MTLVKNNQLNFLIDELFNQAPLKFREAHLNNYVPANILEHEHSYELIINAPGRQKEDFSLEVNNGILLVAYAPKNQSTEAQSTVPKYIRKEFGTVPFKRSFTLDDKIDTDNIGARYQNGLLLIQLPKKEILKASNKPITIQ